MIYSYQIQAEKQNISTPDNYSSFPGFDLQEDRKSDLRMIKRIIVYQGIQIIPVNVSDIFVVFTDNNSRFIQTNDQQYLCTYSLEKLEQMYESLFFRLNRQYMIAYNAIDQILLEDGIRLSVKLKKPFDIVIPVSRRKNNQFIQWLENG